ncbi:MAG: hypothetical protein NUV91_10090, partial [Candidatus Omnitrophica bacterium]|nr:hypothetical protein [Candidatus Omnitrophota bacterium]
EVEADLALPRPVPAVQDRRQRLRFEQLYQEAIFARSQARNVYEWLVNLSTTERVFQSLLPPLEAYSVDVNKRIFATEVMAGSSLSDVSPAAVDRLVRVIIKLLEEKIAPIALLKNLAIVAPHVISLPEQQAIFIVAGNNLETLLGDLTRLAERIREIQGESFEFEQLKLRFAGDIDGFAKWAELKDQYEALFYEVELRLMILAALARNAVLLEDGLQKSFGRTLLTQLIAIARNEALDKNIVAEVVSDLREALVDGDPLVVDFFFEAVRPQISEENQPALQEILREDADLSSILNFLVYPHLDERVGYLILLRHRERQDLLRAVINNGERQDLNINPRFRIYAFSWYAAQFFSSFDSSQDEEPITYDEKTFEEMTARLAAPATEIGRVASHDNQAIERMLDSVVLQDEEAQMYLTAILLALQARLKHLTAQGAESIARRIIHSWVLGYSAKVQVELFPSGGVYLGAQYLRQDPDLALRFFVAGGHELMHPTLIDQYHYVPQDLTSKIVHELLSDLQVFVLARMFGLDVKKIKEILDYNLIHRDVVRESYHTIQAHDGSRAQLEELQKSFSDLDEEKFLKSALGAIGKDEEEGEINRELPFTGLMALIIRTYLGRAVVKRTGPEDPGSMSGPLGLFETFLEEGRLPRIPIRTRREMTRDGGVGVTAKSDISGDEAILVSVGEGRSDREGGISMRPDEVAIEEKGEKIEFAPSVDLEKFESMPFEGFRPVIMEMRPIGNLPLFLGANATPSSPMKRSQKTVASAS